MGKRIVRLVFRARFSGTTKYPHRTFPTSAGGTSIAHGASSNRGTTRWLTRASIWLLAATLSPGMTGHDKPSAKPAQRTAQFKGRCNLDPGFFND
jgi:hypothetical protein